MPVDVIDIQMKNVAAAGSVLAQGFRDDPLFRYIYGDLDLYDHVAPWMFGTWVKWAIHYGQAWATPGIEAVAVLREPGRYHMSTWSMIRAGMFPTARKLGKAAFKRLELFVEVAEQRHAAIMGDAPHWYLQNIAVTPGRQGTGLGKVLMNHSLALADAAGLPCYLETETEKSMGFHEHHGYQVREAVDLPDGGLRFYVMVRPSRAGQGSQPK